MISKSKMNVMALLMMCCCLMGCTFHEDNMEKEYITQVRETKDKEVPIQNNTPMDQENEREQGKVLTQDRKRITEEPQVEAEGTDIKLTKEIQDYFIHTNIYQGFEIQIPNDWKGKCSIEETDKGSRFYYAPQDSSQEYYLFDVGAAYREEKWDDISEEYKTQYLQSAEAGRSRGIVYTYSTVSDCGMIFEENKQEAEAFNQMIKQIPNMVKTITFKEPQLNHEALIKLVTRDMNKVMEEIPKQLYGVWKIEDVLIWGDDLSESDFNRTYKGAKVELRQDEAIINQIKQKVSYHVRVIDMDSISQYFNVYDTKEYFETKEDELLDIFEISIEDYKQDKVVAYSIQGKVYMEIKGGSLFEVTLLC